jgi:hypothetical protein
MSKYTLNQLQQALGAEFTLTPSRDGIVAQIFTRTGRQLGLMVFSRSRIEADLSCRWRGAEENPLPPGFPGKKYTDAASQEIADKLLPDWEIAGFKVDDDEPGGGIALITQEDEAIRPIFKLEIVKDVPTLEDAVKTIQWMRVAEMETSL